MKLSVVMATMNEEEAVADVIRDVLTFNSKWDPEIVVVDSSTDRTPEIAKKLGARVILQEPQGHGVALRKGMFEAKGDVIVTTDCDGTYPVELIPLFVEMIEKEGYDVVSGNRMNRYNRSMPFLNRAANRIFAILVRMIYRIPTHDVTTGMHALRREVVRSINWETNYSFPVEIIVRTVENGYRWQEVEIPYRERVGEVTLHRFRSGRAYMRFILGHRFSRGKTREGAGKA